MRELIQAVLDDPVAALHGRSAAADRLVAAGQDAMPLIADVLAGNWKSASHPIDVVEAFGYIAQRITSAYPAK